MQVFLDSPAQEELLLVALVFLSFLYISHQCNPGGVVRVEMSNLSADVFLHNGTADCLESAQIDA